MNIEDHPLVGWSKLRHLGVHQGQCELRPELDELGIDEIHRICSRMWAYSRADFEPSLVVERKVSQWRETCALAGSIAESLMLSAAALIEAEWHGRAIAAATEPTGMALAQRYLADAAVDTLIMVGHRLINFVVRVARTAATTRDQLGSFPPFRHLGAQYIPFETDDRRAWLSLNAETISNLRAVIPPLHAGSLDILNRLIQSLEWATAFDIRSENFHRWRKEHELVVGVDQNSGHARDIYDADGRFAGRSMHSRSRRHTISDGMTQRTTEAAGNGLRQVAAATEAVLDETLTIVLPRIESGYTLAIDHDGGHRETIRLI
jgi:hypothetical protein